MSIAALGLALAMQSAEPVATDWFVGRWAFAETSCDEPTVWVLLQGGMFVSEDLTGTWHWDGEKLVLALTDLQEDEVTGESGEKFQIEGVATIRADDRFTLAVPPDDYAMKRCSDAQ